MEESFTGSQGINQLIFSGVKWL